METHSDAESDKRLMEFYVGPEVGAPQREMMIWIEKYLPKIDGDWKKLYQGWADMTGLKVLDRCEGGIYAGLDDSNRRSKQSRTTVFKDREQSIGNPLLKTDKL